MENPGSPEVNFEEWKGAGKQNAHRAFPQVDDAQCPAKSLVARGGVEPPTFRFSVGRSYQLSYLAAKLLAVLTGLEPATSALTGRRALQLLHRTLLCNCLTLARQWLATTNLPVPPTGFEPVLPP
jgi:hypothetical protein